MDKTAQLLSQRGSIYGSYEDGVEARGKIMDALRELHMKRHGTEMSSDMQVMFSDLVLKMMRAVQGPEHQDSWDDLEGYARLIKQTMEKNNAES